ncbi:hypothetical protein FB45DRAFT_921644 [Roridomyces roridus]|uniref:RBR-type E3 ubiquitin transferase n=1 Tax=Roridomyces roridus TaxID=1738132 RepID=A0AAD7BME5_9AGAR|nr:hypothetical protein FB45DRAFT_921644 [Roridomyces roridus]
MVTFDPDSQSSMIVQEVLSGQEKIVSHEGASQYRGGGIASCGLAALNFVRIVLAKVEEGLKDERLLEAVVSERTSNEVISICARWPSNLHLEVDDIFNTPLFERSLTLASSVYNELGFHKFREMLLNLQSMPDEYAAVVVTRPPEIIALYKLPVKGKTVFIIFDSHPRPEYPHGSGLILNTSLDATAARLDMLLAPVDDRVLADSLQWQVELLSHFSGHYFVPNGNPVNSVAALTHSVMESSLAVLALRAEVADLKRQRQFMQSELDNLKERHERKPPLSPKSSRTKTAPHPQPTAGPSKSSSSSSPINALDYFRSSPDVSRLHGSREPTHATRMDIDPPSSTSPGKRRHSNPPTSPPIDALEYFKSPSNIVMPRPAQRPEIEDDYMIAARLQMDWDRSQHENTLQAQAKQREFEEEDARLIAERTGLQMQVQATFECGVCFDKYPEDYIARIVGCKHDFCRDCLRTYVISKLETKRYPIHCPSCLADDNCTKPAMITDDLVQTLGLNDQQYEILQELQIASLSILIHCRKCKESIFVDREEHDATSILACPLPRCDHVWCKACQQAIELGGPTHSCDGSSELAHLMQLSGWKSCPSCKTAIQKVSGCNHMTCIAPGCNTHFCYFCGESIAQTALRREVQRAVSAHYNRCTLFEDA